MSKKSISIVINNEPKFAKKLLETENLVEIRKILNDKLPDDSIFTLPDGSEIEKGDESDYTLSEILKEDKIYIKSNKSLIKTDKETPISNNQPKKKNTPIPGSKLVGKKGDLDFYLYPQIEFKDNEKIKAIIFMVVGQTGCGKTTLLNSFINYKLGIEIDDNFRYEIIHETFGASQSVPQISEVTVYNIKAINGLLPIQIIDTPGFR